jgi:hypothetical protein
MLARRAIALLVLFAACRGGSPSSPVASQQLGRLTGIVTIGPNCPVEKVNEPCPTPPGAYALRKVLVYDATRTTLLATVDIDSQGLYSIDLRPGDYLVDVKKVGIDRTGDVPKIVAIRASLVTKLDISIDTGIR